MLLSEKHNVSHEERIECEEEKKEKSLPWQQQREVGTGQTQWFKQETMRRLDSWKRMWLV